MSNNNALTQLRRRVLDESESLAGLLRACLMLGAESGSQELRSWASRELNGYAGEDVPDYRKIHASLCVDSVSGYNHVSGQQISTAQLPAFARDEVTNRVEMGQSIEELEKFAVANDDVNISIGGFPELAVLWTRELGPYQQILRVYYKVPPTAFAGMVGRVRTMLVELVSELVMMVPDDLTPTQSQVDQAVHVHVDGRKNVVSVASSSPSAAVGDQGPAVVQGSLVASPASEGSGDGWWTWPRRIGAGLTGLAAVAATVVGIINDWPF